MGRMKRKGENSCERLARAAQASIKSNSISHVLREELRLSILSRRHANGQDDLEVEFKKPKQYQLTPEEIEKKLRRREQNRRAARRCREKKKRCQEGSFVGLAQMLEENKVLEAEINLLKSQKEAIERFLTSHNSCVSKKDDTSGFGSDLRGDSSSVIPGLSSSPMQTFGDQSHLPDDSQRDNPTNDLFDDNLPQSVIEFCLEHSTPEENDILLYDYGEDMRRQTASLSSVASDADGFGMDSDDSEATFLGSEYSVVSECSEDEDVFQSNVTWSTTGSQVTVSHGGPGYLQVNSYARSQDSNSCGEATFMQYFNFPEP